MVIAAVRTQEDFEKAVKSDVRIIFDLAPDIANISERIEKAHSFGKNLFVHIDLASGIGRDKSGIEFLKKLGLDGIISTKASMIKLVKDAGLKAVQRFFIIDSKSVSATVEGIKSSKADMIEIMPGIVVRVIERLKSEIDVPIIAGGLIETAEDVKSAETSGAFAVSTGKKDLWN
ncbi:MAG TPA: glycerol-3-phosphate responsive antiterminator [Clostridiales bacterium]|nr:glycerol-3-phosphate responsive antiterminator [Clostridiales bacterium]